ncbi:MAG: pilus assembly protein HicB [Alphaproteobacteria bacterium]|nr:pilus assembly protein HicB [Alphaproteobacteria bacterium]
MSKGSIKAAAMRLAPRDCVSLNQWISAPVAEKAGSADAAAAFLARHAQGASPGDLAGWLGKVPGHAVEPEDDIADLTAPLL